MMNMQTHHVCYSRSLGCSAVNPCRLCFDAVSENVLPVVARAFAMNDEQARYLRQIFEEAYTRFHDQARFDTALTEAALDLRRVVIESGYESPAYQEQQPYMPPEPRPPYGYGETKLQGAPYGFTGGLQGAPPRPYPGPPPNEPPPWSRTPDIAPPAPPRAAAPPRTSPAAQSWPTRARPAAPAAPSPSPAERGRELEPVLSALQNLDPGVLAALASIGDAASQGRAPAIPADLDVQALLSAVLPGVDLRSLDVESLLKSYLPPGTDVSGITALVSGELQRRTDLDEALVVDVAPSKVEVLPDTPEKRAERRAARRRAETAAPAPAQLSADDFADAGRAAEPPSSPALSEPNGAPKPS